MNRTFALSLLLCLYSPLAAQTLIETRPVFSKKTSFEFSQEWQYLSTDLYLFNAEKFNLLVNDMAASLGRGRTREVVEYLMITANIRNLQFFGGDLTYPIYNFRAQESSSGYTTQVGQSAEVVRLIDNLPLATTSSDLVEAEIVGQIFTDKNSSEINKLVAAQLKNISKITNPSAAVLGLVGEFGKFMEARAQGQRYEFSSTIRLYQGQDFDAQLHSVSVYVFAPSGKVVELDGRALDEYLGRQANPAISRQVLGQLIRYDQYPFMVVANFKSKYKTDPIIGDEIDAEYIDLRKRRVEGAFEQSLINSDTYQQEKKLIEFLQAFLEFKLNLNTYNLNQANALTEDFSRNFFVILKSYRQLKQIYASRQREFANASIFRNEFRSSYETVLATAELYLEKDNNLKNIKELVNTLHYFEQSPSARLDSANREGYLRSLYSVRLPESAQNSTERQDIDRLVSRLETEQYAALYQNAVNQLNAAQAGPASRPSRDQLLNRAKNTNCRSCWDKVQDAIQNYDGRFAEYEKRQHMEQFQEVRKEAEEVVFDAVLQEECFNGNFAREFPGELPLSASLVKSKFDELSQQRTALQALMATNLATVSLQEMLNLSRRMEDLMASIDEGYAFIESKSPTLLKCD